MSENKVDVIIVGAGPAGISAAITLARSSTKVVVIERGAFAGAKNVLVVQFILNQQKKFSLIF